MRKATLAVPLLLAAVLALAVALFLLRDDARAARADEAARPRAALDEAERAQDAALQAVDAALPEARALAPAAIAPETAGARVAAPAVELPEDQGFRVRVVRADDATPVPGAEVLAYAGDPPDPMPQLADAWIQEHGLRLLAAADGTVRVPAHPEHATLVVARAKELWGSAVVRAPEPGADLPVVEVQPDRAVSALVTDERGAPLARIDVSLSRSYQSGWTRELGRATTGADGLAVLRHVQALEHDEDGEPWVLRVEALFAEMLQRELDPAALPEEPVRFTLPATGSVVVRVLKERRPWTGDAEVSLFVVRPGEAIVRTPFDHARRVGVSVPAKDGVARFAHVGPGLDLAASARRQGANVLARATADGPAAPGESVEIQVAFGVESPVVVVRVLGADGAPLADTELKVELAFVGEMMANTSIQSPRTDAEGRIHLDVGRGHSEGDRRVARVFLGDRTSPDAAGSIDLSREFEPGVHDLGDLRLAPPALLVGGRVIDERGVGVAGAALELERLQEAHGRWDRLWNVPAKTGPLGEFEVRMGDEAGRFRVRAQRGGYASETVEFAPGAEVVVRLLVAGSISGAVLVDEGVPASELLVRASPEPLEPLRGDRAERQAVPDEDGTFEIRDLMPGRYAVQVTTRQGYVLLYAFAGVQVDPGRDTRLADVDLRGSMRAFRITLVPPEGRTISATSFQHGPAGAETRDRWGWSREPEIVILAPDEAIDVDLVCQGFPPVELRDLRGDATVELEGGVSVRVRLVGARPPEPPYYLAPGLSDAASEDGNADWSTPPFDERGETTVRGIEPGRKRVGWILIKLADNSSIATMLDGPQDVLVDVLPGVGDQAIDVHLTQADLDGLIEDLGW